MTGTTKATGEIAMVTMRLDALVLDPRTQPRAELDYAVIAEYREDMERGDRFPPVVAWGTEERAYLSSGWHRYKARHQLGADGIEVDLRSGGLEDAIWHSLATNGDHGKRRTNADKRRAVRNALEMRPALSDREIARHCAVDPGTVGRLREFLSVEKLQMSQNERIVERNGQHYVIETKSIGRVPFYAPSAITTAELSDDVADEREVAAAVETLESFDHDHAVERARLRVQFSHAMRAARELVMLRTDAVADVLTIEQQASVEAFCADMRSWCSALDAALHRPVRLVGGSDAT